MGRHTRNVAARKFLTEQWLPLVILADLELCSQVRDPVSVSEGAPAEL